MRTRCAKCGKYMESGSEKMMRSTILPSMIIETHDDCHMSQPPEEMGMRPIWTPLTDQEREEFLDDPFGYTLRAMEGESTC